MRRLFESGLGFMIVAFLCMVAAVVSDKTAVFIALGGFWMTMGVVFAARKGKKQPGRPDDSP